MIDQTHHEMVAHVATAITLGALGLLEIATPGCFGSIGIYFRGTRAGLDPQRRARLARVIDARKTAEGTDVYTRAAGAFTLGMALLALVPSMPYGLPYSASCAALAFAVLLAYLHFRRATERRVAPLVPRNPWTSFPPLVMACAAICIATTAAFAAFPQYRIGAIVAVLSAIALCAIAWHVAVAPAMLFGDDTQLEYAVDEHVRFCRATGLVSLACAPQLVLVMFASAELPALPAFFNAASWATVAAFLVVWVVSVNPMRKRLSVA